MSGIQLVVTNLDGTLCDANAVASRDTKSALKTLGNAGIPVIAATARASRGAIKLLQQNSIELPGAVLLNGALGVDFRDNTRFHSTTFTVQETRRVLQLFHQAGVEPCVYVESDDVYIVTGKNPTSAATYLKFAHAGITYVDDLATFFNSKVAFSVMCVGMDRAVAKPIADSLKDVADASLIPDIRFGGWTLTVVPPKINKWEGIVSFCRINNISPEHVLAVGDADNDIDLLESARIGCAMSHGSPLAKAAATVLIDTWDGILDFIEY